MKVKPTDDLLAWVRMPMRLAEDLRLQRRRVEWLRQHEASDLPDAERCLAELEKANAEKGNNSRKAERRE